LRGRNFDSSRSLRAVKVAGRVKEDLEGLARVNEVWRLERVEGNWNRREEELLSFRWYFVK
jgi:hypothetical protein